MRAALCLSLLSLAACKKAPPDAPKELADLGLFLFAHFEDEDTAELEQGLINLKPLIAGMDLDADAKDLAVTMPILDGDNLGGLSIPSGADASVQVPVALPALSDHSTAKNKKLAVEPNQVCIESETTKWAGREFLTDESCWEGGGCDRLETLTEVRKESILAKVWYDQYKTYRSFTLEDEDGNTYDAVIARTWTEEVFPADGGNNSWDQLFQLDIYIDDGNQALRWFVMWSSVTLGGIGDDAYSQLVVDGVADAYIYGDEFISGTIDACKNDRNAEKPDRE